MSMHEMARSEQAQLFQVFEAAHAAFEGAFCNALQNAKVAGEALLKLQAQTGRKGTSLFDLVREQAGVDVSDRSCYLYLRIASRWNEISVVAGERLNELSLGQAAKLLQEPKPGKSPKKQAETQADPPAASDDSKANAEVPPDAFHASLVQPENAASADGPPQQHAAPGALQPVAAAQAPDAAAEAAQEAIDVRPPFDQPVKDRLAAVFAQNGPAPTPIQLMTNIVIPNLKRVAEVGISDDDVPFLANAIKEAVALIEELKRKYAIS